MNILNILSVPDPLAEYLKTYCNVNAMEMVAMLREDLQTGAIKQEDAEMFQQQLAIAIVKERMTPTQYQQLTGDNEYNTIDELNVWLRELWVVLYGEQLQPEDVAKTINQA